MADRQAVVFIHGIGEQRPVESLRGFLSRLFDHDSAPEQTFTLPDRHDDSFELQVFVAPARDPDAAGSIRPRTDFYEGYWATEIRGTRVAHVTSWLRRLLLRSPQSLPRRLRGVWWATAVVAVLVAALAAWILLGDLLPWLLGTGGASWRGALIKAVAGAGLAVVTGWLTKSLGDAVRYLDVRPDNVAVRRAVRTRIVALLERLHEQPYARIIVVGHSLGGVIAYDAVRLLWARRMDGVDIDDQPVAAAADELRERGDDQARQRFRAAQHALWKALARPVGAAPAWRISDLVTVGSPIAYPSLLLATPQRPLSRQITDRELPTCPPQAANGGYRYETEDGQHHLHHAAPFAAVRWTNIYAVGDFIGGPVNPASERLPETGLGGGVRNVALGAGRWTRRLLQAHASYWTQDEGLEAVRDALALSSPADHAGIAA